MLEHEQRGTAHGRVTAQHIVGPAVGGRPNEDGQGLVVSPTIHEEGSPCGGTGML